MSFELPIEHRELSVAIPGQLNGQAVRHLLHFVRQSQRQEHLCFGLWKPSVGAKRTTALVNKLILPLPGELILSGSVSFTAEYFLRALAEAQSAECGLVLMHNHFGPGWQKMSEEDVRAEQGRAPAVLTATDYPLLGMTLGTDGSWSGRFWPRVAPKTYQRYDCKSVRVVGAKLDVTFHPKLYPPPIARDEQIRTLSVWGELNQHQLVRMHVGVVGLGSVGRLVVEALARIGVRRVTLIDFDRLEKKNLDRQLGAFQSEVARRSFKAVLARDGFLAASTASDPEAFPIVASVTEPDGFAAALDCDVIFCCVDRPWGRRVLNHVAYAHLIPVIEGGIVVRLPSGLFKGAEWSVRTAGPERCCLQCARTYDPALVDAERRGLLDDPSYFAGLPADQQVLRSENVFPLSMGLAAQEIWHFCAIVTGLLRLPDLGHQWWRYNLREMQLEEITCTPDCEFQKIIASGESVYPNSVITGEHPAAVAARAILEAEPVDVQLSAGLFARVARYIKERVTQKRK